MLGSGVDVKDRSALAEHLPDRRDHRRITSLGEVRHGFEQGHGSTLGSVSSYRGNDAGPEVLPFDDGAPARSRALQALPRRRLPDRVAAGGVRKTRTPGVSLRPGTGNRRGGRGRALAWPRGSDVAPLARARRGGVLRHLLLCIGDAVLPGPDARRTR